MFIQVGDHDSRFWSKTRFQELNQPPSWVSRKYLLAIVCVFIYLFIYFHFNILIRLSSKYNSVTYFLHLYKQLNKLF